MKKLFSILLLAIIATHAEALPAWGISFNPEEIISDRDFFNAADMTREEVQKFLEMKKSTLAAYTVPHADGSKKSAADIIWESATKNGLNPKVLLVLLQKEQSLIENPRPSQYNYDWATGYARCDACPANAPVVAAYKGFATQVEKAAWRKKYYVNNPEEFNFRADAIAVIDGASLLLRNNATASLYNYTPHLRGNFSFWKLWQKYFGKVFPDGMLVKEYGSPDIFLLQNEKKRRIVSISVLRSRYQERNIAIVPDGALETYQESAPVRFMQYSLLQTPAGGVFLIDDDGKYIIPSREVFRQIGFNPEEIVRVSDADIADIPTLGILSATQSPIEELVQDAQTGGVFAISGGVKRPLIERALLQTNFFRVPIRQDKKNELGSLPLGEPVLFSDGTLVKQEGVPAVYIISRGQKRPFASEEAFLNIGFSWNQIIETSGYALAMHPLGAPVETGRIIEEKFPEQPAALAMIQ